MALGSFPALGITLLCAGLWWGRTVYSRRLAYGTGPAHSTMSIIWPVDQKFSSRSDGTTPCCQISRLIKDHPQIVGLLATTTGNMMLWGKNPVYSVLLMHSSKGSSC